MVQVTVSRLSGSIVCQLDAEPGWTVQDVKEWICKCEGVCPCKQQFMADSEILRDGTLLKEHIAECSSQLALTLLFRSMDLERLHEKQHHPEPLSHGLCLCGSRHCVSHHASTTKAAGLRTEGFCASCLVKEASFHGLVLLDAGFHAQELRDIGVSARHLSGLSDCRECLYERHPLCGHCGAEELRQAGFGVREILDADFMLEDCKDFSVKEILDAGVKLEALVRVEYEHRSGLVEVFDRVDRFWCRPSPPHFTVRRLLDAGVDVKQIRDEWIKVGGYTCRSLEDPCFNAREFLDAGIDLEQLWAGGFQFGELTHDGVEVWKLIDAGFEIDLEQLWADQFQFGELMHAGVDVWKLIDANFQWQCADVKQLQRAVFFQELPEFLDVGTVKRNRKRGRQQAKAHRRLQRTKRNRKSHRQQAKARRSTKSLLQQVRRVRQSELQTLTNDVVDQWVL